MPQDGFSSPLFALLMYAVAIAVSTAILYLFPWTARSVEGEKGRRYETIDGLRGFLALGVFIHHSVITWFYYRSGAWRAPPSHLYNELGRGSVALFFMITAFLFWGKLLDGRAEMNWRRMYIGRLFRLYPLYLFMFLLVLVEVFALGGWTLHERIPRLVKRSIPWLMFTIPRASDLNGASDTGLLVAGVTWTLPYEWLFYIALPILGLIFARTKNGIAALFGGLTLVALFGCYAWRNPFDPNILLSFGGGIVAAYWIRRERLRALARGRIAAVLGILCLLLCFVFIQNPFAPIPIVLLSVFFLAVASGNDLFGALKARPVRWLGTISYSTYLLHGLVVWFFLRQAFVELQGRSFTLVCGLACACLVLLNSLTYLLIEKPGMELGRKADSRLGEILQSGRATAKARRT